MSTNFLEAIGDYRFLRDRGYGERAALKLVGDRCRLGRFERNCLFRGVSSTPLAAARRAKLIPPESVRGMPLGVDWYNVLITVESYLKGFPLFLSDDGVVRDCSATHGSYRPGKVTQGAIPAILEAVRRLEPQGSELFLDSPISFSGRMADELRERCDRLIPFPVVVTVQPSADFFLKAFPGVVASSDSAIMDRTPEGRLLDLARLTLEQSFRFTPPELAGLSFT